MWSLFVRLGMVLSTVLVARQVADHFWPTEIHPTRLYRPRQVARYLGATTAQVHDLIHTGALPAKTMNGRPLILGVSVLHYLARSQ